MTPEPFYVRIEVRHIHGDLYNFRELTESKLKAMKQADVVPYYVDCIYNGKAEEVPPFNSLIIRRWSNAGLIAIKEKAWKFIDNNKRA